MPWMVRARSWEYFICTVRTSPGPLVDAATVKPEMYPSACRTFASATFCLDDGIGTSSCIATLALRMRVSMSAMGSVSMMSPARLRHARDLAGVDHPAQADTTQAELAVHRTG